MTLGSEVERLLSPGWIRDGAQKMLQEALAGGTHFEVHLRQLPEVASQVAQEIRTNYPDLEVPFHSRMRHFEVGGKNRTQDVALGPEELFDLVLVSVLLDAGAGMQWQYQEEGQTFSKSEGLAVASFHMFMAGDFSGGQGPRVTADGLRSLSWESFQSGFQVTQENPLLGARGRFELLGSLAQALEELPHKRPMGMMELLPSPVKGPDILRLLQVKLGSIWPGRLEEDGFPLGDVWDYGPWGERVSFHKLSQWLSYSLMEPLMIQGREVQDLDGLTGLAEYRNGGLFLDSGVLTLRDPDDAKGEHEPGSSLIVEWRALTLALLEELAPLVKRELNLLEFPLVKLLQGGTWSLGRKMAKEKRSDGGPPLNLKTDGTVF